MPVPPDGLWGDHWEAPDALSPANGENQEGARELRAAAVKRPHTRAAYAWAHVVLAWDGGRWEQRAWAARVCIGRTPAPLGEGGPREVGSTRGLGTALRTSSASMIASPLRPVHLAAVATACRENVEAASTLGQLLPHPSQTVGKLRQHPLVQGVAADFRALSFGSRPKESALAQRGGGRPRQHSAPRWALAQPQLPPRH